ncbi:UNVERIFIED_CONTAM: hypothetical protein PYX00_000670 [Menopon gallinae]|uniref:Uncharacterized protein n=1 Tax=Menopon gallinae TaxID=328185 RepID=A0AAW2I9X6_9NEOP
MLKVVALIVLSSSAVFTLPRAPGRPTPLELWNPITWWYPFGIAQAESWSSFLKRAQVATSRLYAAFQNYINTVDAFNRVVLNRRPIGQSVQKPNRTASTVYPRIAPDDYVLSET